VLCVGLGGCGGGASTPTSSAPPSPPATSPPAFSYSIQISAIRTDGVYSYDPAKPSNTAGPDVDWRVTYSAGSSQWVKIAGFNAAGTPCLEDAVDASSGQSNGRLSFGNPKSASEWNHCLPKVVRVVAELMTGSVGQSNSIGLTKHERSSKPCAK
jgi:hypothetical protein